MAASAPDMIVRWKSLSGLGLALLLLYGGLNVVSALVVPIALEARAVSGLGDGAVLIANGPEEYMLGTPLLLPFLLSRIAGTGGTSAGSFSEGAVLGIAVVAFAVGFYWQFRRGSKLSTR